MKSYFLLIYWTIFHCLFLYSQSETQASVLGADGKTLQSGLYKSLADFKNNKPSRSGIFAKSVSRNFLSEKKIAKIVEFDSITKQLKVVEEPFWGFATKDKVFIYSDNELCPLELIGKYSVYMDLQTKINRAAEEKWMLLYTETGEIVPLQQKRLISILRGFPEIFAEYQAEKMPMGEKNMMRHYIKYLKKINESLK